MHILQYSPPTFARFALFPAAGKQYVGTMDERRRSLRRAGSFGFLAPPVHSYGLPTHEDHALIAAMARLDERAAAALYDKYSAAMFALAVRIVGESADAEDIVLGAFTQAWNKAARYEADRGSVLGWLTTITRSRALDFVRGRGRRAKAVDAASRSMGDEPVGVGGAPAGPEEALELGERAAAVTSAMSVLSGQQRTAIELAFYDGLTHTEIAERLGEPLGTIKTRIRLGMLKLRDKLGDEPQEMVS